MTTETNTTESLRATKKTKPWIWIAVLGLILMTFLPLFSMQEYARVLWGTPAADVQARADCGVVLTGGGGRVREGIALLSLGRIQKLIISGVHQRSTFAEVFPEILFYPELDLESVILERRSSSTAGNAQHSLALTEALRCKKILLITSDYHMYRAQRTFQAIFPPTIEILPYPVASQRLYPRAGTWFDGRAWGTIFDEWTKYLFYRLTVF